MKLSELNGITLPGFLRQHSALAIVTFHASYSQPARTMLPVLRELQEKYEGVVSFALVDTEQSPDLVDQFGILSLPCYLVYRNSREVDRFIGLLTKEKLTEKVEHNLQTA